MGTSSTSAPGWQTGGDKASRPSPPAPSGWIARVAARRRLSASRAGESTPCGGLSRRRWIARLPSSLRPSTLLLTNAANSSTSRRSTLPRVFRSDATPHPSSVERRRTLRVRSRHDPPRATADRLASLELTASRGPGARAQGTIVELLLAGRASQLLSRQALGMPGHVLLRSARARPRRRSACQESSRFVLRLAPSAFFLAHDIRISECHSQGGVW